MRNKLT